MATCDFQVLSRRESWYVWYVVRVKKPVPKQPYGKFVRRICIWKSGLALAESFKKAFLTCACSRFMSHRSVFYASIGVHIGELHSPEYIP